MWVADPYYRRKHARKLMLSYLCGKQDSRLDSILTNRSSGRCLFFARIPFSLQSES